MAYIWINPVVDRMYEPETLNEFLRQHGHKRLETSIDWVAIVKAKYEAVIHQAAHTVIDMRCPKIKRVLDEIEFNGEVIIPEIKPILIHCGQEIGEKEALQNEEKIITTPCQVLADMGNALGIKDTWFVPWNRFVKETGGELAGDAPEKSPIPPGFFADLGVKTVFITGEEEIKNYFENYEPDQVQIVEMLFCKEGCHNGDGIKICG